MTSRATARVHIRSAPGVYLSAQHLDELADKVDRAESKMSSHERDSVVDVLRKTATAQRDWNIAYSTRLPSERDRITMLVGILGRLLNRWP